MTSVMSNPSVVGIKEEKRPHVAEEVGGWNVGEGF